MIDYANIEIILRILPLLDNLYLAEKNLTAELKTNEYVKGLLQVKTQFEAFLKSFGVEPIEALGKKFDPAFHEAVSQVEDKTKDPETIIEETQKGYLINGQLLRPSKVVVVKQS